MSETTIDQSSLDRGFFHFSIPYIWWMWIVWAIGLLAIVVGIAAAAKGQPAAIMLSGFGFLILAASSPGSLEATLHSIRKGAISDEEQEAQAKERGFEVDSWWLQRTSYSPTNDPNDWVLTAPGPAVWNKEDIYAADPSGEPLPEHPHKVGTPRPATLSTFGVFALLSIGCFIVGLHLAMKADPETPKWLLYIMPGLGVIGLLYGWYQAKMLAQMLDTPTSLIRSMAVGSNELVGQIRPAKEGDLTVVVDNAAHRTMHNMVSYRWTHEVERCRTVSTDEGTREECSWVQVSSDEGSVPFMLHDGTGATRILTSTFKRKDHGRYLRQWSAKHADTLGKEIMTQALSGILGGGRVKRHRWTLWGLRIGNPVYVMGNTAPRGREEAEAEGCDVTVQHTLLHVNGEDSPGVKTIIRRGTELTNLGTTRSGFEMVIIPALMLLGGIAMFLA